MDCYNPSSCLTRRGTVLSPGSPKRQRFFFLSFAKSTNTSFSCCTESRPLYDSSSSSLSTNSYSRRWFNPLRQRPKSRSSPEIVRHWIEADHQDPTLTLSQERFTVMSYNILGDRNSSRHKDLYPNVPSDYMKWAYRKRVICEELIGLNPDIICLQRRTGDNVDGCATFWKADLFRLLEGESIEFKRFGLRDNVAQLSVFEICKAESRRLVVGNIHVLYNPSRGEVKLGQIRFLLSRAQLLSDNWGTIPVILAGDFNSVPESGIYKFLSSAELNIMPYDRRELSGQRNCHPAQVFGAKKETRSPLFFMDRLLKSGWTDEEVKIATGNNEGNVVVNPFKLESTYGTVKDSVKTRHSNGEPLATSYHSKFLGTVDYLWYSDGVVPTRVLDTLPLDILRKTGGLPCKKLGSDHLALVAEFAFAQGAKEGNATSTATSAASTYKDKIAINLTT